MTLALLAWVGACNKVPIHPVNAGFDLADVAWFEEEETLFVFWEVQAEQGLGDPSVVEITWATDDERVDWTPITELEMVHPHREVDCGVNALCGSASMHVELQPREVEVRLRYHRDGDLALDADTVFNVVASGEPHGRSMVVYGVFEETNQFIQWRGRNQFPTVRNEHATRLGLRRWFQVDGQSAGSDVVATEDNPYGYGVPCSEDFDSVGLEPAETEHRAVFNESALPLSASEAALVCADSTVLDATGTFTTDAYAHKNPEVRPAFPVLRSPVEDLARIDFFIAPCDRIIDEDHEEMQRQRLLLQDEPVFCADDWQDDGWVEELVVAMTDAVEAQRSAGDDMALVIGLHRDEDGLALAVEEALAEIVPEERHRASPRIAGAWVFDSEIHTLTLPELEPVTLWCPAGLSEDASGRSCAIAPDNPDLELGPFTFGSLPILPDRDGFLEFIDTYSKAQAGEVQTLELLAPRFATTTEHIDLGTFGSITFLDDESIFAEQDDAFSYCTVESPLPVYVRSDLLASPEFYALIAEDCESGALDPTFCETVALGVIPLAMLPDWHSWFGESRYDLGVYWDFPFLLRMEYEAFLAGSATAFQFSVPFGVGNDGESYLGSFVWTTDSFWIEDELAHCTRFCDHPTFDSAGVYHVTDPFRTTYANSCYRPVYPDDSDMGYPSDP